MNYFLAKPMLLVSLLLYGILLVALVNARQLLYHLRPLPLEFPPLLFPQARLMYPGALQPAETDHLLHTTYTNVPALVVRRITIRDGDIQQIIQTQAFPATQLMDIELGPMIAVRNFLVFPLMLMPQLLPAPLQ